MSEEYLTEQFATSKIGVFENKRPRDAVAYISDILKRAEESSLDVYMLCGSLKHSWRDEYFEKTTGEPFADKVRRILINGGNVSIFVWNEFTPDLVSPEMQKLLEESAGGAFEGKLDLCISGTNENGDKLVHFLIAKNDDESEWLCRVEANHSDFGHATADVITDDSPEVPAVISNDPIKAKIWSSDLLEFWKLLRSRVADDSQVVV